MTMMATTTLSGLIIVDKPAGLTSHDVVARVRRIAGTRKVGHAGTLDPMATGVLVVGVEKATKLLGYLMLTEKEYQATIRLGQSTTTDDAEGELVLAAAPRVDPLSVSEGALRAAVLSLTGEIQQVPPKVSAIKVNGQRAYKLTRAGEAPELAARPVTVHEFIITAVREVAGFTDVDATVRCTSGTYIRSLARDLGTRLGTGGHLTALRRTRVGPYTEADARTLDQIAERPVCYPLPEVAALNFPSRYLTDPETAILSHGGKLTPDATSAPVAAFAPDGTLIALITAGRPQVVFVP
jgi:tRNA pseudouridine55 synthase